MFFLGINSRKIAALNFVTVQTIFVVLNSAMELKKESFQTGTTSKKVLYR